jgi:hypothetical protein
VVDGGCISPEPTKPCTRRRRVSAVENALALTGGRNWLGLPRDWLTRSGRWSQAAWAVWVSVSNSMGVVGSSPT